MHIISQKPLRDFAERHPNSAAPLRVWERIMNAKRYDNPNEVKADFSSVDFIGGTKTVFDIGGNKYRLVVDMMYKWGKVLVRHVLTYKEYDRLSKLGKL